MPNHPISYEAHLALEWQYLHSPPDAEQIAIALENNLECLKQAILMDELANICHDDHLIESTEVTKTEKKLDLLLNLVSAMIEKQKKSDSIVSIKLTSDTVEWTCSGLKETGLLVLQLFIHASSLAPMQLYCVPVKIQGNTCQAKFLYMNDSVHELLEKYIFLTHRRKVAAEKKRLQQ